MAGEMNIGLGGLLLLGGAGLTFATMQNPNGGGAVFYGAMAVGLGLLIKGVIESRQGKAAEEEALARAERTAPSAASQAQAAGTAARPATPPAPDPVPGPAPDATETPPKGGAGSPSTQPASRLPRPSSEQTQGDPDAYHAILCMVAVAIADGEINGSEKTFIRVYPPEAIGARISDENIFVFASMLHQDDIISQLEKAKGKLTEAGRDNAVRLSIMTALSDGGMSEVEEARIVEIANCLGIAADRLQACVDRAHADYAEFAKKHNAEN